MQDRDLQIGLALRIIDETWNEAARGLDQNYALYGLPQVSPEASRRRATLGRDLLRRIGAIDVGALPDDLALTVEVARIRASTAREARASGSAWCSAAVVSTSACFAGGSPNLVCDHIFFSTQRLS